MTRRLKQWIADLAPASASDLEVHFHQGPDSRPAVCHDPHCGSPHLDV
jgi:hypothetical protein